MASSSKCPSSSREVEDIKKTLNHYLPLYKAVIEADWTTIDDFTGKEPDAVRVAITLDSALDSETALMVAVREAQRNDFVKKLLDKMLSEDLAISDSIGQTALHKAAPPRETSCGSATYPAK